MSQTHNSWATADLTSRLPTISSESVLNQSLRVNYGIINTLFRLSSWLTFQPNPFSPIHPIESSLTRLLAEAREYSRRDEAIAALAKVSDSCHFPETVQRQQVNIKFIGGLKLDWAALRRYNCKGLIQHIFLARGNLRRKTNWIWNRKIFNSS